MDQANFAKQVLEFQKSAFDNTMSAVKAIHEKTQQMAEPSSVPKEVQSAMSEWNKSFSKGCDEFQKVVKDNFNTMEMMFSKAGDAAPKTKQAKAKASDKQESTE